MIKSPTTTLKEKHAFLILWSSSWAVRSAKRVLDLGCNTGFWSLCALDAGCDFMSRAFGHNR